MSTELPKAYEPKSVEKEALRVWNAERLFHAEPGDLGEPYSIVIPPPNVTAALHLGHALNNTLQDILTRWHRMAGDNTVWMPGTDHAGIATQTVVEKRVLAEQGKRRTDFQRDEFVKLIQAWKDNYEGRITNQLKTMGCSCDWDRQAFTMDETRAKAVREAFFQLFKDGLIYRGKRLVNWDPATQTALADDEVEMEEIDGHFYYLKYPIVDNADSSSGTGASPVQSAKDQHGRGARATMEYVTVATTRPETMLGDTAVAINPKDPRAAALRGKSVQLPIVNRVIPIIEDDYVVLPDPKSDDPKAQFATGFLKVTPAHDPNDYDIGMRHKLAMINVLAPDGTISDQHGWPKEDFDRGDAGFLLGQDRFEARAAVVEWFKKNNLLENVKPYRHSVGHSYRSHVPIEPYLSDQWYCKVTDSRLAGAALRAMRKDQRTEDSGLRTESKGKTSSTQSSVLSTQSSPWEGKLKFYPARYAKTFQSWHENIRDWCISRQLWWGHRIPVWHYDGKFKYEGDGWAKENKDALIDSIEDWVEEGAIAVLPDIDALTRLLKNEDDGTGVYIAINHDEPQDNSRNFKLTWYLESIGFVQDPDVLDTWFSSGLWPMSTFGWPEKTPELAKWNPTSVLCTAREIITLWVSRMVMFNLYFLNRLPFGEVCIHPMIQDGEGRKMSKSLGNGVDPLDIIDSHGSDAMRFTLTLMTTQTQDVRMPVEKLASGKNTSPKFDIGRNFCNKLWNAARFALMNLKATTENAENTEDTEKKAESNSSVLSVSSVSSVIASLPDRWIISRFNRTVADCESALKDYRFDQYAKSCYDFFWGDFCDWYLEAIKPAMKDPARAGQTANVLASVLDGSLRLMHPMIPFITETIWWKLNDVRPTRGIPGKLECSPSPRLIKAAWPKVGTFAESAEAVFPKIQETISAIRNLRNEHKVDQKRVVTATIIAAENVAKLIEQNREIVELLAMCKIAALGSKVAPPANAVRTSASGVEIYVEGLVDEAAEEQRQGKRREDLKKTIAALQGRLANESYTKKAPAHLVKQTQDQLAEAQAELEKLG